MKLYALPHSMNSRKLLALIHHLDLPVEIVAMEVEQVRSDDFAAINPNRLTPTLVDGEFTLWESNAIGIHLAQDSMMLPTGHHARMDMLRWLLWEGVHYNKALGNIFFEGVVRPQMGWGEPNQGLVDESLQEIERRLPVLDAHLAVNAWMLGDRLSFVDFAMASAEPYRGRMPIDFDRFANVQRWYEKVAVLPAWAKACGKAQVTEAA